MRSRSWLIRVIIAHLKKDAAVSWQGLNFDFTGVVFDGRDFSLAEFSGDPYRSFEPRRSSWQAQQIQGQARTQSQGDQGKRSLWLSCRQCSPNSLSCRRRSRCA